MSTPKEIQVKKERVPGPKTVEGVKDRLQTIAAFGFLGKKAFMDGDYSEEGWKKYLKSIDSPFDMDHLSEAAFEALLKMAADAWNELFDPQDAVEGELIDRTTAAPGGGE
jgi:hypothetical protein